MLAQLQMQIAQQNATGQMLSQQNAQTQNMMLAQAQVASSQQPVYVDQNIYVDQGQYLDVTDVQQNNMTMYTDYSATTDVGFMDMNYAEAYATRTAGEELVYADEAATTGDYYEVEHEADASYETYETDL